VLKQPPPPPPPPPPPLYVMDSLSTDPDCINFFRYTLGGFNENPGMPTTLFTYIMPKKLPDQKLCVFEDTCFHFIMS